MEMKFRKFAPLVKVNEATREIDVLVTSEVTDLSKEKLDWETSRPFIVEYSESVRKSTESLGVDVSLGNVRMMHDPVIAGKFTDVVLDDATKVWTGTIKVKDGEPWEDVLAGHVTGVSIGGEYVKRWPDPIEKGVTRYTANISEVSLVDRPCNKDATFLAVRKDGGSEMRKFAPPRDDVEQRWDCKNDGCLVKHAKKDDARACLGASRDEESESLAKAASEDFALPDGRYDISTKSKGKTAMRDVVVYGTAAEQKKVKAAVIAKYPELGTATTDVAAKSVASEFQKSLWNVATLAGILSQLLCVASDEEWEETWEAIDSMKEGEPTDDAGMKVVGQLKAICQSVFDALEAMLQEERAEIDDAVFGEFAMAAIAGTLSKSPTAKQLIKSLRVLKGNGSTANEDTKETTMSTATATPVVTKEEAKPVAPETVAKALDCNDPVNPHMHEGGVCKAEKIDATVSPVLKAISSLSTKFDEQTAKRTEEMTKVAELETAVGKLAKGVAFLMNLPAAPQGALRETTAISKAEDAAPTPESAAVKPVAAAPVVRKYEDTGHTSSVEMMKTIVAGGLQNIEVPVRGASA
jgi:hypothetical protein